MTASVRVDLPFPPSNHEVFRRHNGKHLSDDYRRWRDNAGWLLKAQRPARMACRVDITIELVAPDARLRDVDNYSKGPIDLLVAHGVIEKDHIHFVRQVTTRWVDAGPACLVIVSPVTAAMPAPVPVARASTVGLTEKQGEAYRFMCDFADEHGHAPSYDEIGAALGLASKSGVHRIVTALEERGRIRRLPNRARAIEIVEARP